MSLVDGRDIVTQIYRELRAAVLDGRLAAGQALPPTRELAAGLKVSRNSVLAAYSRLGDAGLVISRVGAGSFVARDAPATRLVQGGQIHTPLRPKAFWRNFSETEYFDKAPAAYDFRTGLPDSTIFPFSTWRRLVTQELRASNHRTGEYGDAAGYRPLRSTISRYAGVTRGIRSVPDNVTVTAGTQQALDLAARVFLEPADCVVVEEPGYPSARLLFESYGARVAAVEVDDEGLKVTALPDDARMIYLTPSHQYPMGVSMSLERRRALISWAEQHDAIVVEDDYDCEFRYDNRPVDTLHSLDSSGRVLYLGSFSGTMLPSVRLGFLIGPSSLSPVLHRAKLIGDSRSPVTTQSALANFIDSGSFTGHVRRMRQEYRSRRDTILSILRRDFSRWLTPIPSAAGLHLAATCVEHDLKTTRVVQEKAAAVDVAISCLAECYHQSPGRAGLVFGFGSISSARIGEGLERVRQCFEGV